MNGIALRSPKLGQALEQPPAYPRLHEIGTPTLVIWGSCEFPDISRLCQHLVDEIPEAQGQIMRDVAHLPSLERPVEVTGLIARFIDRLGEARPSRR
jgi:pimeloyl-ACP methyl ester carboxylesterase